jgi:Ca-activated chloride channel homolog
MIVFSKKLCVQHTKDQHRRVYYTFFTVWSLFCIVILSSCGSSNSAPPTPVFACPTVTPSPVTLNMVYDDTEEIWMKEVVSDFNNQNERLCNALVTVNAIPISSGVVLKGILNGSLQPDIWSPAWSAWISLLNAQWNVKLGNSATATPDPANNLVSTVPGDTPSLLSSPMVIAMWQSQASALGWPRYSLGWSDIANLVSDPKGWASYKHPEWGKFHFGNSNPQYASDGLEALISMNYAVPCNQNITPTPSSPCKRTGLTLDDVNTSGVKNLVTSIEDSGLYYGSSTSFLTDQMFSHGLTYLNAIAVEESLVVQTYDKQKYPNLPDKLIGIYPSEGTVVSDYPFAILQGQWVSSMKRQAAQTFRDFLLSLTEQTKALQDGFRPGIGGELEAPIDSDHGVDPTQPSRGTLFAIPDPSVVQAIQTNWALERRPFDVMLLADTSGSMNFPIDNVPKIDAAKTGLKAFVNFMEDSDQLGLITFNDHADVISDIRSLGDKRQDMLTNIDGIVADGGALLYNTIAQQFQRLQQLPPTSIRAMIILSNQPDNQNHMSLDQLMSLITPPSDQEPGQKIRIFTIAYGDLANTQALTQIAKQTGGQEFSATPQNVSDVYEQIGELL